MNGSVIFIIGFKTQRGRVRKTFSEIMFTYIQLYNKTNRINQTPKYSYYIKDVKRDR